MKHRNTGLDLTDESWTWDDLAYTLVRHFTVADLSALIDLLVMKRPSLLVELGYAQKGR